MPVARRMTPRTTAGPTEVVYESEPRSVEDIRELSEDGILAYWPAVCRVLENDIHRAAEDEPVDDQPPEAVTPPKATGQQSLGAHLAGNDHGPLTLADAKRMTVEQYEARRKEIDALAGLSAA